MTATAQFTPNDVPVVVLGAGATKACGGPLTAEILPQAFSLSLRHPDLLEPLNRLLVEKFRVPADRHQRRPKDYPPLPLVLTLLDMAVDRRHSLGPTWTTADIRAARESAEYAVFGVIEVMLEGPGNLAPHESILRHLAARTGRPPTVISLNYDVLVDNAMISAGEGQYPDYACDVATRAYRESGKWGELLKIHGSLNWLYCPNCHRLDMGIGRSGYTYKIARNTFDVPEYDASYERRRETKCRDCATPPRPVMITPTTLKDYRNPHISAVWYRALRVLREATRVVFIGYSLPWDDTDVIYLLKRGLNELPADKITIVEHGSAAKPGKPLEESDVGERYQAIFGREVDYQPIGFVDWLHSIDAM
ncbi:MAG: SIR2 family protein [Planctomycetes bacterium]|nr:SIR2 family protein [Planctomycetota bacterium]